MTEDLNKKIEEHLKTTSDKVARELSDAGAEIVPYTMIGGQKYLLNSIINLPIYLEIKLK